MKRYNLADTICSKQIQINNDSTILLICSNDKPKYQTWLLNCIKCIVSLHDIRILLVTNNQIKKSDITNNALLKNKNVNLEFISIESIYKYYKEESAAIGHQKKDQPLPGPFVFFKPFVFQYLFDHNDKFKIKKLLYLDVDTLPLRRLDHLFEYIKTQPLLIEELGFDLKKYNYDQYMHKSDYVYDNFFPGIPKNNRVSYPKMFANSGVIGLDFERPMDIEIVKTWYEYTKIVVINTFDFYIVKWHDQGTLHLALEKLNLTHLINNKDRRFNETIYIPDHPSFSPDFSSSNVVHFVGDVKPDLNRYLKIDKVRNMQDIQLCLCGHKDDQQETFHPRSYLKFCNLNKLDYEHEDYSNNTLGESRIFLAKGIFNQKYPILGCLTASWNNKYKPYIIDQFFNWPIAEKILNCNSRTVFCTDLCYGQHASPNAPSWETNFQKHFRLDYPDTEFIQEKIKKVTSMEYDGSSVCPYANQIICRTHLFMHFKDYMQDIIPKIIDEFGIDFQFPDSAIAHSCCLDPRRPLAYVLEEVSMLWWSKQKRITYVPITKVNHAWYLNKMHKGE